MCHVYDIATRIIPERGVLIVTSKCALERRYRNKEMEVNLGEEMEELPSNALLDQGKQIPPYREQEYGL